ncbi:phage tail protein [Holophaga foetida]|uniref:phage tail protein n=1 Tax=Holophaga foetida TaxID=35839 RepID=UPI000247465D|nr:tail fiber protein [Holophaga foetida]
MADPFVAEIRIFNFNFAPTGWAFCDGQLLPLSQNTALFSLLGTFYGGDGKSTYALPDLQGRAPMHPGQGPGLSLHGLGETSGSDTVTLLQSEIPSHTHSLQAKDEGNTFLPQGHYLASVPGKTVLGVAKPQPPFFADPPVNSPVVALKSDSIVPTGGDQPHNNLQPYLTLNFCIALQGVFPPRT